MLFKRGEVTKWNVWFGLQFNVGNQQIQSDAINPWMRLELPVQCPRQRQKAHFRTNFPSKTDSIPKKEVRRLIRLIRICTDDVLDFCKSMYTDYIYIYIQFLHGIISMPFKYARNSVQESRGIGMATGVFSTWPIPRSDSGDEPQAAAKVGSNSFVFLRSSHIVITNR